MLFKSNFNISKPIACERDAINGNVSTNANSTPTHFFRVVGVRKMVTYILHLKSLGSVEL